MEQNKNKSIQYYIKEVESVVDDQDSPLFYIALSNFQTFCINEISSSTTTPQHRPEEILSIVSYSTQKNALLSEVLTLSLLEIPFGDKVTKANNVSKDIQQIPPIPEENVWHYFKKIVLLLSKTLKSSFTITLQQLRSKAINWITGEENTPRFAGFKILTILLKHFPSCLESSISHIVSIVIKSLKLNEAMYTKVELDALRALIKLDESTHKTIIDTCMKTFSKGKSEKYPGICNALNELISCYPKEILNLQFSEIPLKDLYLKDPSSRKLIYPTLPLIYLTTPELYNLDILIRIYKTYEKYVKKKAIGRIDALLGLGDFLFARGNLFVKEEKKFIERIKSNVKDAVDSPEAAYCLVATDLSNPTNLLDDLPSIFNFLGSDLVINGIKKFTLIHKRNASSIFKFVVSSANQIIFGPMPTDEQIVNFLNLILAIEGKSDGLSESLAIEYSSFLTSMSKKVREICSRVMLQYQNAHPTSEITYRLIAFVMVESNTKLRVKTLSGMQITKIDTTMITSLQSLLNDMNPEVRKEAFSQLVRHSDSKEVSDIIKIILMEKIEKMQHSNCINKEDITVFLLVAKLAFDDPTANYAQPAQQIITPFAQFLIKYLISSKEKLPSNSLRLLALLLPLSSQEPDLEQLAHHIGTSLISYSKQRLNSALILFTSALESTDLRFHLMSEQRSLYVKLLNLTKLPRDSLDRKLLLKVIGEIGPVDPKIVNALIYTKNNDNKESMNLCSASIFISKSASKDPIQSLNSASMGVCLVNILDILGDKSLTSLHTLAFEVLLTFLKTYRVLPADLENMFLERINDLLMSGATSTITTILEKMATFTTVLGNRIATLVDPIIKNVEKMWGKVDPVILTKACEWIYLSVPDIFIPFLPRVANTFTRDFISLNAKTIDTILSAFVSFDASINTIEYIIYPPILKWIICNALDTENCTTVLLRLKIIVKNGESSKHAVPIINTLIKATKANPELHNPCLDIIFIVAVELGQNYIMYEPYITKVFNVKKNRNLGVLYEYIEANLPPPQYIIDLATPRISKTKNQRPRRTRPDSLNVLPITDSTLLQLPNSNYNQSLWIVWYNDLFSKLVRSSPSRAISVCLTLAERHPAVHDSIFPLAFDLFYIQNEEREMFDLKTLIYIVMKSETAPKFIVRHFLAALELLEILGIKCPIKTELVRARAQSVNNTAQALRAAEKLFNEGIKSADMDVILYNQQLGLPLAANGILRCNKQRGMLADEGEIAERLELWEDALLSYEERLQTDANNHNLIQGKLRCLNNLLRFDELKKAAETDPRYKAYEAIATFRLFDKEQFIETAKNLQPTGNMQEMMTSLFYFVITKNYKSADNLINEIEEREIDRVFPMIYEDYERAYHDTSLVSTLNELKEVMLYMKAIEESEEPRPAQKIQARETMERLKKTWDQKLSLISDSPEIMFPHLQVISLALEYTDIRKHWINFLNSAIDKNYNSLARTTLDFLKTKCGNDKEIEFVESRLQWRTGNKDVAMESMLKLAKETDGEISGKSFMKVGLWKESEGDSNEACEMIKNALTRMPNNKEAWKAWSSLNFKLFESTKETKFIVNSMEGSMNGLSLSTDDSISFTVRIVSILFRYGRPEIYKIFHEGFDKIPVHVWIDVLPQIVARLTHTGDSQLKEIIHQVIYAVGSKYPNVALYSLLVPIKMESSVERQKAASEIFGKLAELYPDTSKNIITMTNELIRVAVTWWETWFTSLDEASRSFLTKNDIKEMLSIIEPLHEMIATPAETYFEVAFISKFGNSLNNAQNLLNKYKETEDEEFILQAWQIYLQVYREVKPIISEMNAISLKDASPILDQFNNMQLSVPGSFKFNQDIITIQSFAKELTVMDSKQRPRRMGIYGSDGKKYTYLLKAHEDTRLDERVMQLFGFINSLVDHSTIAMKSHLRITTYEVIPLTGQVGLIGWVNNCNTVYDLVKKRREKFGIPLEIEYKTTMKVAPNYEEMELNDKVFAFKRGITASKGNDLKLLLLERSVDSAHWIKRRTEYTTSLAMTSMSGYILGLGDRHLCNIMIKSKTAKLVHIDFGDCFEVAMHREQFPEKVPFRLTRIMTNALEVSRIEGTFRSCCEDIMGIARKNGEEINGLLEVFVYDPLAQWVEPTTAEPESGVYQIMNRIKDKLNGTDFDGGKLGVTEQVSRLIKEATDPMNLCQMFRGWFPWW